MKYWRKNKKKQWKLQISICCGILFCMMAFSKNIYAAMPGYFENPAKVYEKWKKEIYQPSAKVEYAFLKEGAAVFTNAYGSKRAGRAPKYSGVMKVSDAGSYVQVIYEKKHGYGIGWMKKKRYEDIACLYNGTEKQLLADGVYRMHRASSKTFRTVSLKFRGNQLYEVKMKDPAMKKQGQQWRLIREYGHFYVRNDKTGEYLMEQKDGSLGMRKIKGEISNCFAKRMNPAGAEECRWMFERIDDKNVNPYRNFLQYDPAWGRKDYGDVEDYSGKMAAAGCGAVAVTNAVYALNGQFIDPMLIARYAVEKEYRIIGSGTDDGIFRAAAKEFGDAYGFHYVRTVHNTSVMREYLKKGCVAVSHVPGHYVTVADYNEKTKKYLVLDSHPIPKRPTTPFGDWFFGQRLESGGLTTSGYYIFSAYENQEMIQKIVNARFMKTQAQFIWKLCP